MTGMLPLRKPGLELAQQLSQQTPPSLSIPQAMVYEKPGFEGKCLEIDGDVYNLGEGEESTEEEEETEGTWKSLSSVGSIKILGGL